jgi:hypothetical protein
MQMVKWDEWLTWQAHVTDAIDQEEMEIVNYKTLAKQLLVRRDTALQKERSQELFEIDLYLASIYFVVKMKKHLIEQWRLQFKMSAEGLFS